MTKIKICGLTDPKEAEYINKNHVEMIGNVLFFEKSRRNISIEQAKLIHAELDNGILKVAVVVSPSAAQIAMIEEAGFDLLQIHGKMPAQIYEKEDGIGVIRAFNGADPDALAAARAARRIRGLLWDAPLPGSGALADWSGFQTFRKQAGEGMSVFLAGGLTPENAALAVRSLQPDVADVSSGVEFKDRPGKDPALIDAFVRAVRNC